MPRPTPSELFDGLRAGERGALARSLTLIESTRSDHRMQSNELLDSLMRARADDPATKPAIRLGISGTPGVGKSTFIESLGVHLVDAGLRVAVLAVDPSSARTGGSILGDKTRMAELVNRPEAFIRPSAAGGTLGGVAQRTAEAIDVVEAAGFDVTIVETVGVGQSETAVADITDLFLLLVAPGGGDDLQGIKRGVMELVDLLVVNKADGDMENVAVHTAADYRHALGLLRPRRGHEPSPVLTCSALHHRGVEEVWEAVSALWNGLEQSGTIDEIRSEQRLATLDRALQAQLIAALTARADHDDHHTRLADDVAAGRRSPSSAAWELADVIFSAQP